MTEIVGYYTSNACETGDPYKQNFSASEKASPSSLSGIVLKDEKKGVRIISPPFDPSCIENRVHPEVKAKLLESGHYRLTEDGCLRSVYLTDKQHNPWRFVDATPLRVGTVDDIHEGIHKVYGNTDKRSSGLNEGIRIEEPGSPPVYIVDNHHFAYFAWQEALNMGYIKKGARLIHIDCHPDDDVIIISWAAKKVNGTHISGEEKGWCVGRTLKEEVDCVVYKLSISDFILPAVAKGTVNQFWYFSCKRERTLSGNMKGELLWTTEEVRYAYELDRPPRNWVRNYSRPTQPLSQFLTSERTFMQRLLGIAQRNNDENMILDIDLDALVLPEYQGELPSEDKFAEAARLLGKIARKSKVITIATSPGYTHQGVAIRVAQQIVREIIRKEN